MPKTWYEMTPAERETFVECEDYDPNFKLHGCELSAHDPLLAKHRSLTGREWTESLRLPCPSVSDDAAPCILHLGHFPADHADVGGNTWPVEYPSRAKAAA